MRRVMALVMLLAIAVATGCSPSSPATTPTGLPAVVHYYVDPAAGDDSRAGTSPETAWRSMTPVSRAPVRAGVEVSLRRGSTYPSPVSLTAQGTKERPVLIDAYGDGDAPRWKLPHDEGAGCLELKGTWAEVRQLHFVECGWGGVVIDGTDMTVSDSESEGSVSGVVASADSLRAVVTRNTIHDNNKMSVLTKEPTTDDSGAFGVALLGRDALVSDNDISQCHAFSYDFGTDGSGVEVYDATGSRILRNRITECGAGMELGGSHADDTTIAYNVIVTTDLDDARGIITRGPGEEFGPVRHTRIEHNTVLINTKDSAAIVCAGTCSGDDIVSISNNVVSSPDAFWGGGATVDYNVYFGRVRTTTLASHNHELAARWDDATAVPAEARRNGTGTDFTTDVDGRPVPAVTGAAPSIGAVELP